MQRGHADCIMLWLCARVLQPAFCACVYSLCTVRVGVRGVPSYFALFYMRHVL